MKVKLGILLILVVAGGVSAQIYNQFRNSPTGQVIQQLQEKKQALEEIQKLTLPIQQNK